MLLGNSNCIHLTITDPFILPLPWSVSLCCSPETLHPSLPSLRRLHFLFRQENARDQKTAPQHRATMRISCLHMLRHPFCCQGWASSNSVFVCARDPTRCPLLMRTLPAIVPSQAWPHFPILLNYSPHWKTFYYFSHLK